jgi:6-phospho-3-hexuloisomerase
MKNTIRELGQAALTELDRVFGAIDDHDADALIELIAGARRIAVYGTGREGLTIKGYAMRLYHMGLDAHVVGDMTTPPLGPGDLLIVTSGQGELPSAETFLGIASSAGARTAIITAQPNGRTSQKADVRVVIPAQTMADDRGGRPSVLPMGSLFEFAETIFFELVTLKLRESISQTAETMRARHTNLE